WRTVERVLGDLLYAQLLPRQARPSGAAALWPGWRGHDAPLGLMLPRRSGHLPFWRQAVKDLGYRRTQVAVRRGSGPSESRESARGAALPCADTGRQGTLDGSAAAIAAQFGRRVPIPRPASCRLVTAQILFRATEF